MAKFLLLSLFVFNSIISWSQYENVWMLGCSNPVGVGLDFNSGTPVEVRSGFSGFGEAAASVCDEQGALRFYTNGNQIWDRNHNLMPNSSNITGHPIGIGGWVGVVTGSTSQGALIVPVPFDADRYYVFSLIAEEIPLGGNLYYTMVDMSLNGGLGDVVPGQTGILLDSLLTEGMTSAVGNDCNVWLIVLSRQAYEFRIYEITGTGLNPNPVVSTLGTYPMPVPLVSNGIATSHISVAPNRTKLAVGLSQIFVPIPWAGRLTLNDFDASTGRVSNTRLLQEGIFHYGVCFSPDNSKLYCYEQDRFSFSTQGSYPHRINQYDISLGSTPAIIASKYRVSDTSASLSNISDIKLAPDGKVYYKTLGRRISDLQVINSPNIAGTGCNAGPSNISFSFGNGGTLTAAGGGFPNVISHINTYLDTISGVLLDTLICTGNATGSFMMSLKAPEGFASYQWNNGSISNTKMIDTPGIYWVLSKDRCKLRLDSFVVRRENIYFDLGADTMLCNENYFVLEPEIYGQGYDFLWADGSDQPTLTVQASGSYALRAIKQGCSYIDSIEVLFRYDNFKLPDMEDVVLCKGDKIALNLAVDSLLPGGSLYWSTGSRDQAIQIIDTGTFWLRLSYPSCSDNGDSVVVADTLHVRTLACTCALGVPNAFSPNGDGLNDQFRPVIEPGCPVYNYQLTIYNRYGALIFSSVDPAIGWDGLYLGQQADLGTYFYECRFLGATRELSYYRKGDFILVR